ILELLATQPQGQPRRGPGPALSPTAAPARVRRQMIQPTAPDGQKHGETPKGLNGTGRTELLVLVVVRNSGWGSTRAEAQGQQESWPNLVFPVQLPQFNGLVPSWRSAGLGLPGEPSPVPGEPSPVRGRVTGRPLTRPLTGLGSPGLFFPADRPTLTWEV